MWRTLAVAMVLTALVPSRATALENEDLLALVAMPLAVVAVSEITGVPEGELIDVVTLLNDAAVPPPQFIEVVRYLPVALVVEIDDQPDFAEFIRLRRDEGLSGPALVTSLEQRIRLAGVPDVRLEVTAPRIVDIDDRFIPLVVTTRIAQVKAHPHGGPPGQLKKVVGVRTGAAIVHDDDDRGRRRAANRVVDEQRRPDDRDDRKRVTTRNKGKDDDGDRDRGKGKGKAKGQNKGKGKGKG